MIYAEVKIWFKATLMSSEMKEMQKHNTTNKMATNKIDGSYMRGKHPPKIVYLLEQLVQNEYFFKKLYFLKT